VALSHLPKDTAALDFRMVGNGAGPSTVTSVKGLIFSTRCTPGTEFGADTPVDRASVQVTADAASAWTVLVLAH
jgi:hypothetical protein